MEKDFDSVIIGAGVIGLAIGYSLAKRGHNVLILERNATFGEETSSRNSEVIHAGIYYAENSLKARLCVEGKKLLYAYCRTHKIPHQNCGKLIVATTEQELAVLKSIRNKANKNGVHDLADLTVQDIKRLEPQLSATGGLLSPSTGIIDTHQYMLSLVGNIQSLGGHIAYQSPFEAATVREDGFVITCGDTEITCTYLVNSGGLQSQLVSSNIKGLAKSTIPQRHLTKGSYFTMSKPSPFKHLIYPVPNTASLGVHVTLDLAGQVRFGPDQEWVQAIDYSVDPARAESFYEAIRKYYPALPDNCLQSAYSGIRPKIQGPNDPMMDFCIQGPKEHGIDGLMCLYGMESPGLTSSLAIGEYVANGLNA
ncbi:NAD(P)/FAD-dependent oxidoreductase [Sneathiella glossodoripedis]|uniref:NAD(P)/FAD-dependent oxidoreductase n=1 Tax=Sneathiella glossodoripedis TaxID=418853 RepID=UPI0004711703|nr:NAD(P)/FAD-dependent oxidoreductase [Sneathiella glossodoripedis]